MNCGGRRRKIGLLKGCENAGRVKKYFYGVKGCLTDFTRIFKGDVSNVFVLLSVSLILEAIKFGSE